MQFKKFYLEVTDPYAVLGVSRNASPEEIRSAYRRLAMQYHPDRNVGDKEALQKFKDVSNAWDELDPAKVGKRRTRRHSESPSPSRQPPRQEHGTPEWQTDLRSTYNNVEADHRGLNFNKKYIYEKSLEAEGGNKAKLRRMNIWAFDGVFSRGMFTVFGSDKVYPEMAKAMKIWNSHGGNPYHTEAILVSEKNQFRIIWIKGKNVNIPIEHDSPNANGFNDHGFVRQLKSIIEKH